MVDMSNTTHATHATGSIQVTSWVPTAYDSSQGPTLNLIEVTETFQGDLEGEGKVRFLQALRADGSASFCGLERVVGALGGKRGSFLLQDEGTLVGDRVEGRWFVIPGSGTGELAGLRGEGTFEARLGAHSTFTLDYRFEP